MRGGNRWWVASLVLASGVLLAACGGGGQGDDLAADAKVDVADVQTADPVTTDDTTVDGDLPTDVDATVPDGDQGGCTARGGCDAEGASEDPGEETPDISTDEATGPDCSAYPRPALCPCNTAGDCDSLFCVPTASGSVCSAPCSTEDSCPKSWLCQNCAGSGEPNYCCVDPAPSLCQPCKTDQDCIPTVGADSRKRLCIDRGPQGRFCGVQCTTNGDCPDPIEGVGFVCADVQTATGMVKQCQPDGVGGCPCTAKFKDGGYLTVCYEENSAGKCLGERTCATTCTAKMPKVESCNFEDDDCNGKVDDSVPALPCPLTNTYGTCQGHTVCTAGQNVCTGAYAQQEICNGKDDDCNGQTDENVEFLDNDGDGIKDCVDCDIDGDGVPNNNPGCPACGGAGQPKCDNCTYTSNVDQFDYDGDGQGNACDCDNDNDGVGNNGGIQNSGVACPKLLTPDNCEFAPNPNQNDTNKDGLGDACDCDIDGDGVKNDQLVPSVLASLDCPIQAKPDNCKFVPNADQIDTNKDGTGDACSCDMDSDGVPNNNPGCLVVEHPDNCPTIKNLDQADTNKNGVGDACDCDIDGDGILNQNPGCADCGLACDNCTYVANASQADSNGDRIGDACDCDIDGDTVMNQNPGCPDCGTECDNCPYTVNKDQLNTTGSPFGDACNTDWDNDGVPNGDDNCPYVANANQNDMDGDGQGDACDCDIDGDSVPNAGPNATGGTCADCGTTCDNCASVGNTDQHDLDTDGIGDACDCDIDGDGDNNPNPGCAPCGAQCDCAPLNAEIFHAQLEKCNLVDDNCNGVTDEENAKGCTPFYPDQDVDGYGAANSTPRCFCTKTGLYSAIQALDCNDALPLVNPGVQEDCKTTYDDNCDGSTNDEGATDCIKFYNDEDGDKWGTSQFKCMCHSDGTYTAIKPGDCNDDPTTGFNINPGRNEDCNTPVDDNCNGDNNDENASSCHTFYYDGDSDGYGVLQGNVPAGKSWYKCFCAARDGYLAAAPNDCDDTKPLVHPGVKEICGDGIDNNCDGYTDKGSPADPTLKDCNVYYYDGDQDGYGVNANSKCLCHSGDEPFYTATDAGDCNDTPPGGAFIHPKAKEICNNVDDNCNLQVDEAIIGSVANPDLCGPLPYAVPACQAGTCVIGSCVAGYFNTDGINSTGCECSDGYEIPARSNDTCGSAFDVKDLVEGVFKSLTGQLVQFSPSVDVDWYRIRAVDTLVSGTPAAPAADHLNFHAYIMSPQDGSVSLQVVRVAPGAACGSGSQACAGDLQEYNWRTDFSNAAGGRNPCITDPSLGTEFAWDCNTISGDPAYSACCETANGGICGTTGTGPAKPMHYCIDDTADYYVKVYWTPGKAQPIDCNHTTYIVGFENKGL